MLPPVTVALLRSFEGNRKAPYPSLPHLSQSVKVGGFKNVAATERKSRPQVTSGSHALPL
jgi:hypothetical protein